MENNHLFERENIIFIEKKIGRIRVKIKRK